MIFEMGLFLIVVVMLTIMIILLLRMAQLSSRYAVVKFWSYFYPGRHMVRLIDHQNSIYHTLVEPGPDHTLVGHIYWSIKVGGVILKPNGVVDTQSDACFVYGWEHVDPDLKLQQKLSWPNHKSLDVWPGLTHREKWDLRNED